MWQKGFNLGVKLDKDVRSEKFQKVSYEI